MKNLLTLLTLAVTFTASAQWKNDSEKDPFTGRVDYAFAVGSEGRYPYNNPTVVIRKVHKIDEEDYDKFQAYITDAGSTVCNSDLSVIFVFDSDPSTIETFQMYPSVNDDTGFFHLNRSIVDKFKKHSYMHVKYRTGCSQNTFKVSLRGSTSAITKIGL